MKRFNLILLITLLFTETQAQFDKNFFIDNPIPSVDEESLTSEDGYLGAKGKGKYSIWYACDINTGQQRTQVKKPFIWVEGINLSPVNTQRSNKPKFPNYSNVFYLPLMRDGFDIVQLDFSNNPQWIQRNAELLITLIEELQDEMGNNGHEIVVMGTSMGAIITRFALAKMEHDGVEHNVRLYISHDGPNRGANIPWGLQYMAQDITKNKLLYLFGGSSLLAGITNTLASVLDANIGVSGVQATLQLTKTSPIRKLNGFRSAFVADLFLKGNYPNDCRKVAIANGANNGEGVETQGANHQILRIDSPSTTSLLVDRRAHAAPGISIELDLGFFGTINLGSRIVYSKLSDNLLKTKIRFYPPGLQNWDIAPGGTAFEDSVILGGLARTRPFTFMPMVSALGLKTFNPFYNLTSIPNFGKDGMLNTAYTFDNPITEFDAIWADEDNTPHAQIEESYTFIREEVSPNHLFIQNKTVKDGEFKIFEARNSITLSYDESPAYPVGDVVFEDGSTVILRSFGTIDLGSFEPDGGIELDIQAGVFYNCQ